MRRLTTDVTAGDVQAEVDRVWRSLTESPELKAKVAGLGLGPEAVAGPCPFTVSQEAEGYGLLDTILVEAAGGVVAGLTQAVLWKLWDVLVRPRVSARVKLEPKEPASGEDEQS